MSVTVNDYRKHMENRDVVIDVTPLAAQVESAVHTGDTRLDKLARMAEHEKELCTKTINDTASQGMGSVQEEMFRLKQFEYFYNKGRIDAFTLVQTFPDIILQEENRFA